MPLPLGPSLTQEKVFFSLSPVPKSVDLLLVNKAAICSFRFSSCNNPSASKSRQWKLHSNEPQKAISCTRSLFAPKRTTFLLYSPSTTMHFCKISASLTNNSTRSTQIFTESIVKARVHSVVTKLTPLGNHLVSEPKRWGSSLGAVVDDATAAVGDATSDANEDSNFLDDQKMISTCDKLIGVFMVDKPTPTDWRRLLAFSREWSNIRPHFFRRCQERADAEDNQEMKHKLFRLGRKLKEVDEDVERHNELLVVIRGETSDINAVVARRRKDFTKEFFEHLHAVAESYYDNPEEQNVLAKLGNTCLAAVQAYDSASQSIEALNAAELKFQDIINSPNIDVACKKIDNLAEKNQLDSALVLMISKAWSAAKESNMMKDEVKDILYHLYTSARGNLQRLMPKEIRILKYILTIKDPEEQFCALRDAFTPGNELEGKDVDALYTTPEKLHSWIKTVVEAYHFSREGTLIREARDLMSPQIIQRLEELKKVVENKFM